MSRFSCPVEIRRMLIPTTCSRPSITVVIKISPERLKDIPVVGVVYKGNLKLNKGKRVGGDRDAHGCIGSAGYSWCEKTKNCQRPWTLADRHDFDNTKDGFDRFCQNSVQ